MTSNMPINNFSSPADQLRDLFTSHKGILDETSTAKAREIFMRIASPLLSPEVAVVTAPQDFAHTAPTHPCTPTQDVTHDASLSVLPRCEPVLAPEQEGVPDSTISIKNELKEIFAKAHGVLNEDQLCRVTSLQQRLIALLEPTAFLPLPAPMCAVPVIEPHVVDPDQLPADDLADCSIGHDSPRRSSDSPRPSHQSWVTANILPKRECSRRRANVGRMNGRTTKPCEPQDNKKVAPTFADLGLRHWGSTGSQNKSPQHALVTPVVDDPV